MIRIPQQLADADDEPARLEWLACLPSQVDEIASEWSLELGEPYLPGGQCAWVAPVRNRAGDELVLKVGWRHREAEQEADALRFWDGRGTVRCVTARTLNQTTALLLERCVPGSQLKCSVSEVDQDVILAGLLRRLWGQRPPDDHPFGSLQEISDEWAESFEAEFEIDRRGLDPGLAREGMATLRELPRTADRSALLCVDLHAGNILAAKRERWLVIDPKPFVGDPAFDAVQHMLNCEKRLATDPAGLSLRMASLLEVDPERVRLWLFARCVQESLADLTMRALAHRLAK